MKFFRDIRNTLTELKSGLSRNPVPPALTTKAQVKRFPGIRSWEVEYKPDVQIKADDPSGCNFLALSGGGSNGAFGAGFLNGWTESGTRPDFKIVTGISTGGLIAPGAFIGSGGDKIIKNIYTTVGVKDIYEVKGLLGLGVLPLLFGESYASTKPLDDLLAKMVDQNVLRAVAAEHAKGKRLYIGTTNLDSQRFMIWNMGAIASSGQPDALKLFRTVMMASISIPGVFPPVYFDVEVDGKKYNEMHVDGSIVTGVLGYGSSLFTDQANVSGQNFNCNLYIIRNGKLASETRQVQSRVLKIVKRSFETLMKSSSWKDLFRLYGITKKDNVDFNYVSIPDNYEALSKKMFNHEEMDQLFELGFKMAKTGYKWRKNLPGFDSTKHKEFIWTPM